MFSCECRVLCVHIKYYLKCVRAQKSQPHFHIKLKTKMLSLIPNILIVVLSRLVSNLN